MIIGNPLERVIFMGYWFPSATLLASMRAVRLIVGCVPFLVPWDTDCHQKLSMREMVKILQQDDKGATIT